MVMLGWSVAVFFFCLSLGLFSLSSVLNFGVPSLLCCRIGRVIWGIDDLNVARSVGRLLDRGCL